MKKSKHPLTPSQRVKAHEDRKRARGMVRVPVWVYKADKAALKEHAAYLTQARELGLHAQGEES